jgi:hypothetical protein
MSCFMLLIKFLFHVQIIELEKMFAEVENELKSMEEARKMEVATKKGEAKRPKETTKDMLARWMKDDGGQGCSKDTTKK